MHCSNWSDTVLQGLKNVVRNTSRYIVLCVRQLGNLTTRKCSCSVRKLKVITVHVFTVYEKLCHLDYCKAKSPRSRVKDGETLWHTKQRSSKVQEYWSMSATPTDCTARSPLSQVQSPWRFQLKWVVRKMYVTKQARLPTFLNWLEHILTRHPAILA